MSQAARQKERAMTKKEVIVKTCTKNRTHKRNILLAVTSSVHYHELPPTKTMSDGMLRRSVT